MKKAILYSSVTLVLITILLFRLGFFYISVSSPNTYKLNKNENELIKSAISLFKERVENENFNEIRNELVEAKRDENWIINDLKNDRAEFGKSLSWEIFRVAQPQPEEELNGKIYHVDVLTKTERQEVYEHFIWLIKEDNEIRLIFGGDMDTTPALEWRIGERDKQKTIAEKYPNEIIIPFSNRYIEFRY